MPDVNLTRPTVAVLPEREAAVSGPARASRLARAKALVLRYGMVLVLVMLVIAAQLVYSPFLSLTNLQNLATQNASTAIVAVGMTFVIIGGGFDLSVTGIFGLGSVFFANLAVTGTPVYLALAIALAIGVACGLLNGLVITKLKVNTFVATLGTAAAFTGAAALYSGSKPIPAFLPGFDTLGAGRLLGVAVPVILLAVLYVVGGLVLNRTVYGRSLFATGGNREAARLAGLRVDRVQIRAFMISGLLAALAGAVLTSNLATGQFDQGSTVALDAIAAVVIGGTSLYGGEGAMWRTLVGVLILATMNNLFSSLSIATPTQNIIKGLVIVAAVAFEEVVRRVAR